ncbi:hypothetical protein KUV95_17195 [Microbulbifer agarilyticus]|uniref:hypothetical protein n=1 Tax=Microbulbifer agarilyticus TaxID=260552 RepID=UPI001C964AD8|nr:hypothetical protein [Microbulbifer agarilyticus]MBY6213282.1 hypothetical protein [Microbulbifer agarilyticus]
MKGIISVLMVLSFSYTAYAQEKIVTIDPNQIQMHGYVHQSLPQDLLKRIKVTTDTLEIIDGISFEQAVDLYKRDLDPESNLVIWEEMARVYNIFCKSRCDTAAERKEVYRALLLRSMFSSQESLARLQLKVLSVMEAQSIISQYKLEAKPIDVIQK